MLVMRFGRASFTLTRTQLYDLVWSEPMQKLSKQIGISDVALAKACRKIGVPVPTRGYWAKLQAGKSVLKAELPPADLGTVRNANISGSMTPELHARIGGGSDGPDAAPDDLEVMTERFRKRVGKITVARNFERAHPLIAKLLAKDEEHRQKKLTEPYYWREPKFDSPLARRRLRIVNALLLAAAKVGGGGFLRGEDLSELYLTIGDRHIGFTLDAANRSRSGRRPALEKNGEKLAITLQYGDLAADVPTLWEDQEGNPLESRLTEIFVRMAVASEHAQRKWLEEHRRWQREEQERLEREARQRKLDAERRERERLAAIEQAKLDALVKDAGAWKTAADLRSYISAVAASMTGKVDAERLNAWCDWARAQADAMDPLTGGRASLSIEEVADAILATDGAK